MEQTTLFAGVGNNIITRTPIEVALDVDQNGMTTARKLYAFLELAKGQFSRWAKTNILENEFAEENIDFWGFDIDVEGNITQDYKLTSSFAKKLSVKGGGARAEEARQYFASLDDKAKQIANEFINLSPELKYMIKVEMQQKQQEKEMLALKEDIKELNAKVTTRNENYFTVAGYASLRGLNVDINKANMLGRKAAKLSKDYNYTIAKVKDARFGHVNSYHVDILKEVFKEI